MVKKQIIIQNPDGLHGRLPAMVVQQASTFISDIVFEVNGIRADAKSILSVIGLGAYCGEKITVFANGKDEEKALEVIANTLVLKV